MRRPAITTVGLVAAFLALPAHADICKYRDGEGTVHYLSSGQPEPRWELLACIFSGSTRAEESAEAYASAMARVTIGMTKKEVQALGQVGDQCTDWPKQGPPACGPLYYYVDRHEIRTASAFVEIYKYGRDEIVYKNGAVVMIRR